MRHRTRDRGGRLALMAADWKFRPESRQILRWITTEQGTELVNNGRAVMVLDPETYDVLGFRLVRECQIRRPRRMPQAYRERPHVPVLSNTAFSRPEVMAVAGEHFKGGKNNAGVYGPPGGSRTARMNDEQRRSRIAKGMREMDLTEAARVKLNVYRHVH